MKNDPQLRLSLLALHLRVQRLGSQRNFFLLLAIFTAAAGGALYYFPEPKYGWLMPFVFIFSSFNFHRMYFIDLPRDKSILAFFEQNHPEMCSWLEESAVLEAAMAYEQKVP